MLLCKALTRSQSVVSPRFVLIAAASVCLASVPLVGKFTSNKLTSLIIVRTSDCSQLHIVFFDRITFFRCVSNSVYHLRLSRFVLIRLIHLKTNRC